MSDELFSVTNQNVLVTGGSRGIGRAIAQGFALRGANVLICSRSQDSVDTAIREMLEAGLKVSGRAWAVRQIAICQDSPYAPFVPGKARRRMLESVVPRASFAHCRTSISRTAESDSTTTFSVTSTTLAPIASNIFVKPPRLC